MTAPWKEEKLLSSMADVVQRDRVLGEVVKHLEAEGNTYPMIHVRYFN